MREITTEELYAKMEDVQQECHKMVANIKNENEGVSVQDATNVFIFMKIASLQLQIDRIQGF